MSGINWVTRGGHCGAIVLIPEIANRYVYLTKSNKDDGEYAIRDFIGNMGCRLLKEAGDDLVKNKVLIQLPSGEGVLTGTEPGAVEDSQNHGHWESHLRTLADIYLVNPDFDTPPNSIDGIKWLPL